MARVDVVELAATRVAHAGAVAAELIARVATVLVGLARTLIGRLAATVERTRSIARIVIAAGTLLATGDARAVVVTI